MAKAGEKGEQKANLYLLAIVAIVAVVGIVVLVLNSGGVSVSSSDLSGQVISAKTIKQLGKSDWMKLDKKWYETTYDKNEDSVKIPKFLEESFILTSLCTTSYTWYVQDDPTCNGKSRGDAYYNPHPALAEVSKDVGLIWFNVCCSSTTSIILAANP